MTRIKRILIDADGCPVVNIAIRLAKKFAIECIILCDDAHVFDREGAQTITIQRGQDGVDFHLVNMANETDVVITQDYGLAAMCIAKMAQVMHQDGALYDHSNIEGLLFYRHQARKIRAQGGRTKGQPKRKKEQDADFEKALTCLLQGND